jgi:hypothetical protein
MIRHAPRKSREPEISCATLSIPGKSFDYLAGGNTNMQYLMLIYDAESSWAKMSSADQAKMYEEYGRFTNEIKASGKHVAGHQLKPVATATTVRVRDGKRVATDGPFAETKEQLGGFYLINANDLDEAIAIAAKIPSAKVGSIEVRPIVVHEAAAKG